MEEYDASYVSFENFVKKLGLVGAVVGCLISLAHYPKNEQLIEKLNKEIQKIEYQIPKISEPYRSFLIWPYQDIKDPVRKFGMNLFE